MSLTVTKWKFQEDKYCPDHQKSETLEYPIPHSYMLSFLNYYNDQSSYEKFN